MRLDFKPNIRVEREPTPEPVSSKDPHQFPTFDPQHLAESNTPVLYLPPLLSSLPADVQQASIDIHDIIKSNNDLYQPPLTTATRLPDIDPASLSLHKALHHFRPLSADYASVPYAEAFNWDELELPENEDREWYCVVFRSKRKPGSDGGCQSSALY
jgi:hypothetical protein